ncbi:MAG: HAD family hydrolase, partial [Synechococcales bacterium]|nr:HAD family hydrolase [Synechococcales bacterium]
PLSSMPYPLAHLPKHLPTVPLLASDMDGTLTIAEKFTPQMLTAMQRLAARNIPLLIVTGRSAGWVSGVAHYLPIAGAIAENGGVFYQGSEQTFLVPIEEVAAHRQKLAAMFQGLQAKFPNLRESHDNQFRLTDWTFDVAGLSLEHLREMAADCHAVGWSFTYSTVQCHIKLPQQEKAQGLAQVLQRVFPGIGLHKIVALGDSPNDESLFALPYSVGVANVQGYLTQMQQIPKFITTQTEGNGFCELVELLLGMDRI